MSETATYTVPGMSCERCLAAVTEELTGVSGVRSVDVDLQRRVVRVHGEPLDDGALRAAIAEAGYEAE